MTAFAMAHPWLTCATTIIAGYLFAKGAQTICRTWMLSRMFSRPVMLFDTGAHPLTDSHKQVCAACADKETRN